LKKILTIITVTYNCADVIRQTLESILTNKPGELEYIVVDGVSNDGTMDILRRHENKIDQLIFEPDHGIYDAMNKGLQKATGNYILYINAGDSLYDETTLSKLMTYLSEERAEIYYGDTMLTDVSGGELGLRSKISSRKLPSSLNWKSLQRGMVVSHQSFIVKRSLAPEYDLQYKSSADIDWIIKCLKGALHIENTNMVISNYPTGGFSKQRHSLSLKERYLILHQHYGFLHNLGNHLIILSRALWHRLQGKALN